MSNCGTLDLVISDDLQNNGAFINWKLCGGNMLANEAGMAK